jgi:hypothetical protein
VAYRALACSGPLRGRCCHRAVVARYEEGVPEWAIQGRFFDRPRCVTGTKLTLASTNNCLIATRTLMAMDDPFAARFSISGGEDTYLFRILIAAGARIAWADEAIVEEHVPATRARLGWLVRPKFAAASSSRSRAASSSPQPAGSRGVLRGLADILPQEPSSCPLRCSGARPRGSEPCRSSHWRQGA